MIRTSGLLAAASLACAVALSGCVSPPRGALEPLDSAAPIALDDPEVALQASALVDSAADRSSLVGRARVTIAGPGLRLSRPQRIAVRAPANLRVEILGLFDQVAAILTTDGRRYQFFEAGAEIQEGAVYPGLLWTVARVDLDPEEAVGLLLGTPWQPGTRLEAAGALPDDRLLLAFRNPRDGARRIFELDRSAQVARVRQRAADDVLLWEVSYADYRLVGARAFAHEIEIDFPQVDARADFRFESAELNRELPESAFDLRSRSGSRPSLSR